LSGPAGAKCQKSFEEIEVTDVRQAPYIAFDVSLDVIRQPHLGRDLAIVDARIEARAQGLPQVKARRPVAEEPCRLTERC
jgi:hypothetical protein